MAWILPLSSDLFFFMLADFLHISLSNVVFFVVVAEVSLLS